MGHPVDVATGTLFNHYFDYSLRGLMPLAFGRFYSTALIANGPGPLGWGFRHIYQHELRQSLEGWVYIDEEGNEVTLTDDGSFGQTGKLTLPAYGIEVRGTVDRVELENYGTNLGTVLVFVRRPNSRHYDLVSMQGHPQNRLDLAYDGNYRLSAVKQSRSGYRLRFAYDALGRISTVTCEAGRHDLVVQFEYDAAGDLVVVRDPHGVEAQLQYQAHRMVSESIRSGGVHEFLFDGEGRCVRAAGPDGFETRLLSYDADARTTVVTDSKGAKTIYEYNPGGQITKVTDALGNVVSYAYDAEGRSTSETNAKGVTIQKQYDAVGRLRSIVFPDATTYELEWSETHRLSAAKGPSGLVWRYTHNDVGLLIQTENPKGDVHQYSYDDYGQIESVVTPIGAIYRYQFNGAGHFVGFVDPLGNVTSHAVDGHGNVLETHEPTGAITRYSYDDFDRVVEARDALGQVFRYEYDIQGRLARSYEAGGHYIEYHYNTCGLPVAVRRADGVIARAEWDTEPGRILSIRDGNGRTLRYTYDALGRPVERYNWDGALTKLQYDPLGKVVVVVAPDGTRQEYEYDAFGQMVLKRSGDVEVKFEYDVNGAMTAALAPDHEIRWERDLYGRALAEIQDNHRVEYQYDAGGRRTSMMTPLGQTVGYEWTIASQLQRLAVGDVGVAFEYDPIGRELERNFSGGGRFSRRYDLLGRLVHESFAPPGLGPAEVGSTSTMGQRPVGFSRDYSYDRNGHLQQIRDSLRGTTDLYHDQLGQLRAAVRIWGQAEYFDYDATGNRVATARLSVPVPPTPDQVFGPNFGPLSMNQDELTNRGATIDRASVGPGNQIRAAQTPSGGCEYELNASGFVVEKRVWRDGVKQDTWRYDWDDDGRLVRVERPDGSIWKYEYDPLGRRVRKQGPAESTSFVWDGSQLLHVIQDGKAPMTYLHAPMKYNLLMCLFGDDANFVLPDLSSSVSESVKADGVASWWRINQTWGESLSHSEGEPGFTGQWLDRETGLYYNHFRYYDPELGRYLSPDPIGLIGGLNEYAYVPSPFQGFDPNGLAKALGGGPMDYSDPNRSRPPDLRNNRQVTDTSAVNDPNGPYNTRTVPSPNSGQDNGGKCLSVLRTPDGSHAFVSGQGRQPHAADPNTPHTTPGQMGNWTHAEVQALHWLSGEIAAGRLSPNGTYQLFIDRPFCARCESTVPQMLADLRRAHPNLNIEVRNQRTVGTQVQWEDSEAPHPRSPHC